MSQHKTFIFNLPKDIDLYDDIMCWVKYGKGLTTEHKKAFERWELVPSCPEEKFFNSSDGSITILVRLDMIEKEGVPLPKRRGRPPKKAVENGSSRSVEEEWETTEDLNATF